MAYLKERIEDRIEASAAPTPMTRRAEFIAILRDKSKWPKDFKWDYSHHWSCALGLHQAMRGEDPKKVPFMSALSRELGISTDQYMEAFYGFYTPENGHFRHGPDVTPEDVANRLESY